MGKIRRIPSGQPKASARQNRRCERTVAVGGDGAGVRRPVGKGLTWGKRQGPCVCGRVRISGGVLDAQRRVPSRVSSFREPGHGPGGVETSDGSPERRGGSLKPVKYFYLKAKATI